MSTSAPLPPGAPPGAPPRVGDPAPDVPLPRAAGEARRLSDFRGSPVVLAFHDGRWDPARAELVAAYNRLVAELPGAAGATLLSVGGEGTWRELAFDDGAVAIPVVADDGAAAERFGVRGASAVFVVDAAGVVRWRHVAADGPLPRPDELRRALRALAATEREDVAGAAVGGPEGGVAAHSVRGAWTRRDFVATALGATIAVALSPLAGDRAEAAARALAADPGPGTGAPGAAVPVTLRVNGREVKLTLEPRVTLLDALREYAGLTGSKKGCDHGQCGACTVHVNGRRVLSCLTFAVMQQGKEITTIEGLAGGSGDALHPMQQAFITHDGFQCGYCTPGQIMSACAVVNEPWGPDDADVREAMSGNICRCGAYPGIVAAVQEVRRSTKTARGS